jgi:hypothetical protein
MRGGRCNGTEQRCMAAAAARRCAPSRARRLIPAPPPRPPPSVYDVTRRETFEDLERIWMKEVDIYRCAGPGRGTVAAAAAGRAWGSLLVVSAAGLGSGSPRGRRHPRAARADSTLHAALLSPRPRSNIEDAVKMVVANKVDLVRGLWGGRGLGKGRVQASAAAGKGRGRWWCGRQGRPREGAGRACGGSGQEQRVPQLRWEQRRRGAGPFGCGGGRRARRPLRR